VFFLVVRMLSPLYGQDRQAEKSKADSLLKKYGEVYLVVPVRSASGLLRLSRLSSVDAVYNDSARICLNKQQYTRFISSGIPFSVYEIVRPAGRKNAALIWQGWNTYPTYGQYDSVMLAFAGNYPAICRLDTLGYSVNGRKLLAVKISDHVDQDEPEPEFMYSSTMHGDETGGYILMLRLINHLLSNYGTDSLATALVDSLEIWICPLANPDGTYMGGDQSVNGAVRYNANGVDLNRNFPDPQDGDHPDGNEYQPETMAMIGFHESRHIGISVNFHSGDEVVNYPWDTWPQRHADDNWFQLISRIYADTVHRYSSGYMTGFDNGITNGYDWYSISGGRQDYVTYFREGRESTIELDYTKITPEAYLDTLWKYNYRSLLYYAREAMFGIDGFVTDSVTGLPVKSVITIPGHDTDSSEVSSDSLNGYFHRYLAAGIYNLSVSATGYITKSVPGVEVQDHKLTRLAVFLQPGANVVPVSGTKFLSIFPNPVMADRMVTLRVDRPGDYRIRFYTVDGQISGTTIVRVPASGRATFSVPSTLMPGLYLLHISGSGNAVMRKLIIFPE